MISLLLRLLRTIADRETRRLAIRAYYDKYDPKGEERKRERQREKHRKYYYAHKRDNDEAD